MSSHDSFNRSSTSAVPASELKYFSAADAFASVFDGKKQISMPASLKLVGFADPNDPAIPRRHDSYVFRREILRDLLAFLRKPNGDALFITGPTGSGKTSVISEVCARLQWPVQQLTLSSRFEFSELTGHFMYASVRQGEAPQMRFQYGPLAIAMKKGHVLILNEADLADAGELAGLNDILEGRPLVLPENGGEIIHPHPMFRVVVTANSCGSGDATGLYAGVQQLNLAFLDRFRLLRVDYQNPEVEWQLLSRVVPSLSPLAKSMVKLANEVRALFAEGQLSFTLSTRTLLRWAQIAGDFRNSPNALEYGLERALLIRAEPEEAKAVRSLCEAVFGDVWTKAAAASKGNEESNSDLHPDAGGGRVPSGSPSSGSKAKSKSTSTPKSGSRTC